MFITRFGWTEARFFEPRLNGTLGDIPVVDWAPFIEFVDRHRRFLLTTHVRPDGDGLGSMLALMETLEARGKVVQSVIASTFPPRYHFLDPDQRIKQVRDVASAWADADAIAVLDTGTWNQLGDFGSLLRSSTAAKVVIDHHQTQDDLGARRFLDTSAEATGRLTYEAIQALGGPLTERAANALFVALAMDTGWFRHGNTTSRTFDLAAKLVDAGACPTVLYDKLFEENTLPRLRLMGVVLERLQVVANGRVAWSVIHRDDYPTLGATPQDSEDLVNFTRSIGGVEVGILFMEQPRGGIKVSLRSRGRVNVARIAEQFGGGGHAAAAGATLNTTLEETKTQILRAISEAPSTV